MDFFGFSLFQNKRKGKNKSKSNKTKTTRRKTTRRTNKYGIKGGWGGMPSMNGLFHGGKISKNKTQKIKNKGMTGGWGGTIPLPQ